MKLEAAAHGRFRQCYSFALSAFVGFRKAPFPSLAGSSMAVGVDCDVGVSRDSELIYRLYCAYGSTGS